PRYVLDASREDELGHSVQRDRYCPMLRRSASRMMGIRDGAELVDDGVPPESLEQLVCPASEQDGVEARDTLSCRLGLLLVRHDPVELPVRCGKVPVRGDPGECHDPPKGHAPQFLEELDLLKGYDHASADQMRSHLVRIEARTRRRARAIMPH